MSSSKNTPCTEPCQQVAYVAHATCQPTHIACWVVYANFSAEKEMAAPSSGNVLLLSSSSSSSSPPSTSHLTAVLADCLPISGFSLSALWSRHKPYPAAAAAAGGNPRTRMPITLLNLKKKRLSPFSERNIRGRTEEASTISAANGQDDRRQAMRFSTSNGDDANGKLVPADDDKALLNSEAKVLTLPTILTLGRVAAIPVLLCVFYSNEWWATAAVACIFVLAAITDWLDGFLARKMGSNSTFGAFLDPVADKLMVATTLVLLSTKPLHVSWAASLPWLIPLPSTAIIGREITMSAVREWAASQGGDLQAAVAVNKLGKWKTASQMVALAVLLATRNASESGMACQLVTVGVGLLYISAGLALWSLVVYMKGIWGALIK